MCFVSKTLPEMPQGSGRKEENFFGQEVRSIGGPKMLSHVRITTHDAEYFHSGRWQCKIIEA